MRRTLGLITLALCVPLNAYTAEDLATAYRAGLTNDPRFQSARYEYASAREALPQAVAGLLPVVTLDRRKSDQSQDVISRDNAFFGTGKSDFTTDSHVFQLSQPVFRMESFVRLGQSKAFVRQAYAVFIAAEQDFIIRTAEAYLTVLAARDNLRFARAEQTSIARQLTLVQARRRGGLATVTDEYEAQARAALVEADVIAADYASDDAYQALREIVGDAVTDVYVLREQIPLLQPDPANVDVWIDRALENNLNLIARNEAVTVAEQEVRRRRAGHYPTLDLVARHGNTDSGGSATGGGASDIDDTTFTLQLTVPIYSGGIIRSQTREASNNHRRAQEERKLQHRVVMRETRAAFQGVRSAISRVEALGDSLRSQESALAGRTKGYRSGVNTLLDVLDAERDLTSTRRDYARARYEYLLNLLRLKQQEGSLAETDLLYINALLEDPVAQLDKELPDLAVRSPYRGPPAATQPPITQPLVTQAPVTEPPAATQPLITQAPVTQAPVTQAPVTQAPVTEPPAATQPPVTQPLVTQTPVTQPLVTRAPLTEPPLPETVLTVSPESVVPTHIVNTTALRVRIAPDINARQVNLIYRDDEVQALRSLGAWSLVIYETDGVVRTGWVASRLIVDRP